MDAEGARHLVVDGAYRATSYSTVPHEYGKHFREGTMQVHIPAARRRYFHPKCTFIRAHVNPTAVSRLLEKQKADSSRTRGGPKHLTSRDGAHLRVCTAGSEAEVTPIT